MKVSQWDENTEKAQVRYLVTFEPYDIINCRQNQRPKHLIKSNRTKAQLFSLRHDTMHGTMTMKAMSPLF